MTFDISLEAIESDLRIAEGSGSPGVLALALARAQVRATLLAAQPVAPVVATIANPPLVIEADHQGRHEAEPVSALAGADIQVAQGGEVDIFTVPKAATWVDRVTAAAMLLGIDAPLLALRLHDADGTWENRVEVAAMLLDNAPTEDDARAGEPEEEPPVEDDDVDADFFAEARKARKKK